MALEPGTSFGPYRIIGPLGQGGMASVYRAFQPTLRREVAIKVIGSHLAGQQSFRARFRREAEVLAQLEHPNILPVYDYGEENGQAYIVYRYVAGGTLRDRLGQPLPPAQVVRLLTPVAAALDFAHARGVVHRDIKPSNILLTEDGMPIVADFGLARILSAGIGDDSESLTQAGTALGTPAYMAPEQVQGHPAEPRTDQYALGIVAYEMLTGSVPFAAETPLAVALKHVHEPLPPPSARNSAVNAALQRALITALAKNPADRYPSCGAFAAAMDAAARGGTSEGGSGLFEVPAWRRGSGSPSGSGSGWGGAPPASPSPSAPSSPVSSDAATRTVAEPSRQPPVPAAGWGGGSAAGAPAGWEAPIAGQASERSAGSDPWLEATVLAPSGTGRRGQGSSAGGGAGGSGGAPDGGQERRVSRRGFIVGALAGGVVLAGGGTVLAVAVLHGSHGGAHGASRGGQSGNATASSTATSAVTAAASASAGPAPSAVTSATAANAPNVPAVPSASATASTQPTAVHTSTPAPTVPPTVAALPSFFLDGDGPLATARFNSPQAIVADRNGNFYIADSQNHRIRLLGTDGRVTTVAGTGEAGYRDGPGNQAKFNFPTDITIDSKGNLYVVDFNNKRVRRIATDGTVGTLGSANDFIGPGGVTVDANDTLYISDVDDKNARIRKTSPPYAAITTLAGGATGFKDGPASVAQFSDPLALAVDRAGNLYTADQHNNRIRKIAPDGTVSTFAGSGAAGYANGMATAAQFHQPVALAIDRSGNLYVTDLLNYRIRKITPAALVTTLAGSGGVGAKDGPSDAATFGQVLGITVGPDGEIYVTDSDNNRIRKINASGVVTTLSGSGPTATPEPASSQ